jgi:hypothetical protein
MPGKLDITLASVAVKGALPNASDLDRDKLETQAKAVAAELGPGKIDQVGKRLVQWPPPVTAKAAGNPSLGDTWGRLWTEAVAEVLFQYGAPGLPAFWPRLEKERDTYREIVLQRLFRFAANGVQREEIMARLRRLMPQWHHTECSAVVAATFSYAPRDPRVLETLRELRDVPVNDCEDTIAEFVRVKDYEPETVGYLIRKHLHMKEVGEEYAARKAASASPKPPEEPVAEKQFAAQFALAIVNKDFQQAHELLAAHLKQTVTTKGLKKLVQDNTRHSGWPHRFEIGWNSETASSLRNGPVPTALPAEVTDANMLKWMSIQFLPEEGKDVACFDFWMAVIDEKSALRVGYYEIADAD